MQYFPVKGCHKEENLVNRESVRGEIVVLSGPWYVREKTNRENTH